MSQKLDLNIFTHIPRQNSIQVLITFRQGEITHPLGRVFSKVYSPAKTGRGREKKLWAISQTVYEDFMAKRFKCFFYLLYGCPTGNFGPLSRRQPPSSDVHPSVVQVFNPMVTGSLVPNPGWAPSRTWTGNLPILSQRLNPLNHSPSLVLPLALVVISPSFDKIW